MPISPNPVPQGGAVGEKMHKVYLEDLSPAQRSRMRNGHKVRAKLSRAEGKGCSCMMNEGTIKKLLKKGGKGEVSLSGGEIEANKISGTGLIEGGRKVSKHKGEGVATSSIVQKPKKAALKKMCDELDEATGGRLGKKHHLHHQQSEKDREDERLGEEVGSLKRQIKKKSVKGGATTRGQARAQERQKRCSSAGTELRACHKGEGRGLYARSSGRGLYGTGVYAAGGAIGKAERVTNIGAGGNLIHGQNPALRPQAGDANFFLQFYGGVPPSALPDY